MGVEADDENRHVDTGRAIDVALAEFEALRAEIVASRTIQSAFVGVGLTSAGLIFGFAIQQNGHLNLLLLIPPLGLVITILHLAESFHFRRLGDYIRTSLWPFLQSQTGFPYSWESEHFSYSTKIGYIIADSFFAGTVPFLFAAISALALIYAKANSDLKIFGWFAVGLTIAIPLISGLEVIRRRRGSTAPGS